MNDTTMRVSVDIKYLRDHISILYEQRAEAASLVECLEYWYKQASFDGSFNYRFIEKHLKIANSCVTCIQRRILLLESMVEKFSALNHMTMNLLEDAIGEMTSSNFIS